MAIIAQSLSVLLFINVEVWATFVQRHDVVKLRRRADDALCFAAHAERVPHEPVAAYRLEPGSAYALNGFAV
jgi:hypothetical protein